MIPARRASKGGPRLSEGQMQAMVFCVMISRGLTLASAAGW